MQNTNTASINYTRVGYAVLLYALYSIATEFFNMRTMVASKTFVILSLMLLLYALIKSPPQKYDPIYSFKELFTQPSNDVIAHFVTGYAYYCILFYALQLLKTTSWDNWLELLIIFLGSIIAYMFYDAQQKTKQQS